MKGDPLSRKGVKHEAKRFNSVRKASCMKQNQNK